MNRVAHKIALVTGASSGMGLADARLLLQEGARVVLSDIDVETGNRLAQELGDDAFFLPHNVADEAEWCTAIAFIQNRFGSLDILVNNAGYLKPDKLTECSVEDWQNILAVNAQGQFLGMKHAVPLMAATGGGSIINVSSTSVSYGLSNYAAYTASKGAVDALTRSTAAQCVQENNNVRINTIEPDGVKTPLIIKSSTGADSVSQRDMEKLDKSERNWILPEDIANLVLFLASDESRCINGTSIRVDQGACILPPAPIAKN